MQRLQRIAMQLIPRSTTTYFLGKFSRMRLSRKVIPWYVRKYQINVWELDRKVEDYPTLHSFFCRSLHSFARPLAKEGLVSPVDGLVTSTGLIDDQQQFEAKGQIYSLFNLLHDEDLAHRLTGGQFWVIYLSPRDYHRIHIPYSGLWVSHRHIPGHLYPVNSLGEKMTSLLFAKNERVVTEFRVNDQHFYVLVSIGAFGVGSVRLRHMPRMHPFRHRFLHHSESLFQGAVEELKGEEFGRFELGSTVILLTSPGFVVNNLQTVGQRVKMGSVLANVGIGNR
ncbi:archaetidylserine decarboxylase [Alicyclobacillus tolerans]|uniref:phosphatidylserine decarboxylase n=2 Tax=Alicyclobacillus tolerans TaxID=90970 RepID=A0ABT9LW33_9BACL|nr:MULTISPECIES: archaetidylserine decarboxylase [Alicyclobacillus]MDP9728443.1 phosphatidylserine decarboxylase [Alicyclobacillus tengchongensis]SHK16794.1 phosphatidylserine decarboxylase [Alicyclobacillus montanus]